MRLPRLLLEEMMEHSRRELPRECLGLLLGSGCEARRVVPLRNVSRRPEVEYRADPRELLDVLRAADSTGLEVVAIYHSHPSGPAFPSATDREMAAWRTNYLIIDPSAVEVRAFKFPAGEEVELVVE